MVMFHIRSSFEFDLEKWTSGDQGIHADTRNSAVINHHIHAHTR